MSRIIRNVSMFVLLGLAVGLLGCNDPNKNLGRDDQTVQSLNDRIQQLEAELAAAQGQRGTDQAEIDRLRRELDALRAHQGGAAPAGWTGVPGGAMTSIEGTVLFDSGKADLKPGAKKVLTQVSQAIKKQFPDREIYIFGHTDNEPIRTSRWKDNYELSCQRALSVVRYIQKDGASNSMAACGWGEHRPVAPNSSKEARQANRRVEIYAMNPQK